MFPNKSSWIRPVFSLLFFPHNRVCALLVPNKKTKIKKKYERIMLVFRSERWILGHINTNSKEGPHAEFSATYFNLRKDKSKPPSLFLLKTFQTSDPKLELTNKISQKKLSMKDDFQKFAYFDEFLQMLYHGIRYTNAFLEYLALTSDFGCHANKNLLL